MAKTPIERRTRRRSSWLSASRQAAWPRNRKAGASAIPFSKHRLKFFICSIGRPVIAWLFLSGAIGAGLRGSPGHAEQDVVEVAPYRKARAALPADAPVDPRCAP